MIRPQHFWVAFLGNSASFIGVAYGNNKFVAMNGHGYSSRSTDGINWTQSLRVLGLLVVLEVALRL